MRECIPLKNGPPEENKDLREPCWCGERKAPDRTDFMSSRLSSVLLLLSEPIGHCCASKVTHPYIKPQTSTFRLLMPVFCKAEKTGDKQSESSLSNNARCRSIEFDKRAAARASKSALEYRCTAGQLMHDTTDVFLPRPFAIITSNSTAESEHP
jgi:hypothetical protein